MGVTILSERNEQILLSLKKFDYLTTGQISTMFNLIGSNVYRVLNQLEPYVNKFKDGALNIYYLNSKGQELVGCEKVRRRLTSALHYIMRNDLYIHMGQPSTWQNEMKLKYSYNVKVKSKTGLTLKPESITVVCDAYFTSMINNKTKYHLIEIDNTQQMKKNKTKIDRYRRLIEKGAFKQQMPELIWVTVTEYRRKTLLDLCDGLDTNVYLGSDLL